MGLFRRAIEKRNASVSIGNEHEMMRMLGLSDDIGSVKGTKALHEATVFSCVKIKADAVSKLPLQVHNKEDDSSHPIGRLLKIRPNPYMTRSAFFKSIETNKNLYGNGYAYIDSKHGVVKALYPLDSSKVQIVIDNVGLIKGKGENLIHYIVKMNDSSEMIVPNDKILHFKDFTLDGIVGYSPLDYLQAIVESSKGGQEYVRNFISDGMTSKGLITYVGDLNESAKRTFKDKFEEMSSGLKNAGRVSMLPLGYQYQNVSFNMADAQFLENSKLTVTQIASAFGVKMHQLNDLDRSTHTNIQEQQRSFYVDTLQAVLEDMEQEMDYKLLSLGELDDGWYFKFNVNSIVRSDIKTRYESYRIGVQGGFITPNEVRALEELQPMDNADVLLVNGSYTNIDNLGEAYRESPQDVINEPTEDIEDVIEDEDKTDDDVEGGEIVD